MSGGPVWKMTLNQSIDRMVALRTAIAFSDSFCVIQPKPILVAFNDVLVVL